MAFSQQLPIGVCLIAMFQTQSFLGPSDDLIMIVSIYQRLIFLPCYGNLMIFILIYDVLYDS